MKRFLTILAVLSVMLCGFGTAHAVLGVADDVPGTDVVIPFICEVNGNLNTLWAIGEVSNVAATAQILVYDRNSTLIYDSSARWTARDIVTGDCKTLVAGMSTAQKTALKVTMDSKDYYMGYVIYYNAVVLNQFVPWVYLVDATKGFASGFNGYAAENVVSLAAATRLAENNGANEITASSFYPRYFLLNSNADTFTWWIFLVGLNTVGRTLDGVICNEEESCISLSIPVPSELNVINVNNYLPAILHTSFPKAGMGIFIPSANPNRTWLGWSYQRQQANSIQASWDVIHPIHRTY